MVSKVSVEPPGKTFPKLKICGARTLLGAPGLTTSNNKATRNKGIATRSKKLLGTRASQHRISCFSAGEEAWMFVPP